MNSDHIIRVMIRGYDQLSGAVRDAVNKSDRPLNQMRDHLRDMERKSKEAQKSVNQMADDIGKSETKINRATRALEELGKTYDKLKVKFRDRLASRGLISETPEDQFDRLQRAAPQSGVRSGGRFVSRDQFVAEENARRAAIRAEAAATSERLRLGSREQTRLDSLISAYRKMGVEIDKIGVKARKIKNEIFEGKFFGDDIVRGFQTGRRLAGEQESDVTQGAVARIRQEEQDRAAQIRSNRSLEKADLNERIQDEKNAALAEGRIRQEEIRREIALEEVKRKALKRSTDQELKDAIKAINEKKRVTAEKKAEQIEQARADSQAEYAIAKNQIDKEVRYRRAAIEKIESDIKASENRKGSILRDSFAEETRRLLAENRMRAAAERASIPDIIDRQKKERAATIAAIPSGLERQFARLGAATQDFRRGFRGAKNDLEDFEGAARKAQTVAAQLGAAVGDARKSISNVVNIRWLLLIGLIGSLGTVVVELGAALIAVASSALLAAAALGGALLSGVLALLPAVGLLFAVFQRLSAALNVVHLRQQARNRSKQDDIAAERARRSAAEGLSDAHYGLAQAIRGVADAENALKNAHDNVTKAEQDQKDAIKDLATARRDASRAIVDANLEERDAALALKEAEQGVLDAKQKLADFDKQQAQNKANLSDAQAALREAQDRLAAAKAQGDAAEIASAQSAVNVASGNVSSVQDTISQAGNRNDLVLAVQRAIVDQQKAQLAANRAAIDAARLRKDGINGAPAVIAAQRRITDAAKAYKDALKGVKDALQGIKDAQHSVVLAHRSVRDAQLAVADAADKMSQQQRNAQREFLKLSPAERQFVLALERFQKQAKKLLTPITDIIIESITKGLGAVTKLMQDPAIQKAFKNLADTIASIGDSFAKWIVSPEARRLIVFFINEGAKSLPTIAHAFGEIGLAILGIGKAAAPVFEGLIKGIDRVSKKLEDWTKKPKRESPFDAFHHHEDIDKSTSAAERFFGLSSKHLSAWSKLLGAVGNFFGALISASAGEGLKMVQGMASTFNDLADKIEKNPKAIRDFFERVRKGLSELLPVLGKAIIALAKAFTSKEFIDFTKFVVDIGIPAILDLIKALGFLVGLFDKLFNLPVVGGFFKFFAEMALGYGIARKLLPVLKGLDPLLIGLFKAPFKTIGLFIGKIGGAYKALKAFYDLSRAEGFFATLSAQFPKIASGLILMKNLFATLFIVIRQFIIGIGLLIAENPILLLIAAVIAGLILLELKFHVFSRIAKAFVDTFIELFTHPIRWLKEHWKELIIIALLAPFGALPSLLYPILRVFFPKLEKKLEDGFVGAFVGAFRAVRDWFKGIGAWLNNNIVKPIVAFFTRNPLGHHFVDGIIKAFETLDDKIIKALKGLPKRILNVFKGLGGKIAKEILDGVRGGITGIAGKALGKLGDAGGFLKNHLPAGGGDIGRSTIPVGHGPSGTDTVPAYLTPGEWVLNKIQQMKLAKLLGISPNKISDFLFGAGTGGTSHFGVGGVIGKITSPFRKAWAADQFQGRFENAWQIIAPHLPRWYNNHDMTSRVVAAIVRKGYKPEHFIQYAGNQSTRLRVIVEDRNKQFIVGQNIGKTATADRVRHYAAGGQVAGEGQAVPIIAHAGEWVVNRMQQAKLAQRFGTSADAIRMYLFGSQGVNPGRSISGNKTRPNGPSIRGNGYTLIPHQDDYGVTIWFLELANGAFAQVTARDAKRIQDSHGRWFPGYVNRAGGPALNIPVGSFGPQAFKNGGIVTFTGHNRQAFSAGGVVGGPVTHTPRSGNTIHQNFNVQTQGDSDWGHIMELGAQKAQGSFSG